jgi:hypothetical protein
MTNEELDLELGRWLRTRTCIRYALARPASPLDETSMALRAVRSALGGMDSSPVVLLAYRWAIRVARELEAIEQLQLDGAQEWSRYEAFAPFALAFFDTALAKGLAGPGGNVAQLRHAFDAVIGSLTLAMQSSALAA